MSSCRVEGKIVWVVIGLVCVLLSGCKPGGGRPEFAMPKINMITVFPVSFVDARNGWAAGEFGTIIHTKDGGETWEFQSKDIDKMLNGVCFVDAQNGSSFLKICAPCIWSFLLPGCAPWPTRASASGRRPSCRLIDGC